MEPRPWLSLPRTARFGDTDGAGVMHFHQLLRWCHEAYEESLERFGIPAAAIFPTAGRPLAVALPISHCQADFLAPVHCGEPLRIVLTPRRLDPTAFEVGYTLHREGSGGEAAETAGVPPLARALSRHVAIDAASRRRCPLPDPIARWLEASGLGRGVQAL
ncbi:acyl-CoA thioesterase [Synechococcus sp. RSCCF101]|uniref:acyl-CoA thioesterase n=1 Tax=Synechococcus sp. RSCCF101 TaxID=2511069 RepID=UPI001245ACC2|nr:thioesterase family protein [Synechococcus sp. RSCCF101]QEY32844.1 acyl-CoA thioesterase [Synechococcus sp. RSCCF101]